MSNLKYATVLRSPVAETVVFWPLVATSLTLATLPSGLGDAEVVRDLMFTNVDVGTVHDS